MIRCSLANSLWQLACAPGARRFGKALREPGGTQEALLRDLIRRNERTRFGREHGFSRIRSIEDYRARVPIRTYGGMVPWIEAIRRGERHVLTADPVTRLVPTGGSSGGAKLIPWTSALGRDFARALAPWIADLFGQRPALKRGPAYWSVSPAVEPVRAEPEEPGSSVPIGFDGDSQVLAGPLAALIRPTLAVPEWVGRGVGGEGFQYTTLLWLLHCRELRIVSVWHPSFFGVLLDRMVEWWDALVEDVGRGTRRRRDDPPRPDRGRAAELRALGPLALERIWPRLGLVSCWTDAAAAASARALAARLPHVPIQGKGLLATEGFSSIPFRGARPLAVRSHFFEFLDGDGRPHLLTELVEGRTYTLVLSTSGGLYRYLTHDRVRVTGRVAATPSIRFEGRGDRVSDLRGEKLTDGFVQGVLDRLFGADERVRFAMLAPGGRSATAPASGAGGPDPRGLEPHTAGYTLFVEAPPDLVRRCGERLDGLLRENPQYRWARDVGQLAPPDVFVVREGAQRAYLEAEAARGRRLGDIKPVALDPRTDWRPVFAGAGTRSR